ncbi:hypothetical protein NCS52_01431600 [Fusarium sp. LHS14.1]|nr:hypothetical protein NCS52_01431600 [Fusarium sp. LHS14.1]
MARFLAVLLTAICVSTALSMPGDATAQHLSRGLITRQTLVAPPPCEPIYPPPSEFETKHRFNCFANAFLITKNLTEAFQYISKGYINHNPFVTQNGSQAAFDFLAPIWPTTNITFHRKLFRGDMGRVNYNTPFAGDIIDRFRWEDGCIVEHWDVGEVWPTDK